MYTCLSIGHSRQLTTACKDMFDMYTESFCFMYTMTILSRQYVSPPNMPSFTVFFLVILVALRMLGNPTPEAF